MPTFEWLILALIFLGLGYVFAALAALSSYSRSTLEERYAALGDEASFKDVLENDIPTIVALRAWVWLLLMLGGLVTLGWSARLMVGGDGQPQFVAIAQRAILAWAIFVAIELWVARPLGRLHAESLIIRTWAGLRLLRLLMAPVLWAEQVLDRLFQRIAGRGSAASQTSIEEEILAVVSEGEREGTIREHAADMIERVIDIHEVEVSTIMTPRTDMIMLKKTMSIADARNAILEHGHSRIPVYGDNRDDIVGILYAKDLLPHLDGGKEKPLVALNLRKPVYVPETKPIDALLREFQQGRVHIAIVLDEYGGVAGLVTIEDVLEEIVGDIVDEFDDASEPPIVKLDENRFEVDARVRVDEINEEASIDLPEEDDDFDTVGGFIVSVLGHIPKPGESVEHNGITLVVLDASDRAIGRVSIERAIGRVPNERVIERAPSEPVIERVSQERSAPSDSIEAGQASDAVG